jgi:predicted cobalt transporter CbtA
MGFMRGIAYAAVIAGLSASAALAQNQAPAAVGNQVEAAAIEKAVKGTWKNPAGGTCEAAYFKADEVTKTVRGENALATTVVNAGTTVKGQAILAGAREGQVVNPTTDKAIFLLEPQEGDKLHVIPVGEPALAWPEVVLELCPGSR